MYVYSEKGSVLFNVSVPNLAWMFFNTIKKICRDPKPQSPLKPTLSSHDHINKFQMLQEHCTSCIEHIQLVRYWYEKEKERMRFENLKKDKNNKKRKRGKPKERFSLSNTGTVSPCEWYCWPKGKT